jgi:hypothetical protein
LLRVALPAAGQLRAAGLKRAKQFNFTQLAAERVGAILKMLGRGVPDHLATIAAQ